MYQLLNANRNTISRYKNSQPTEPGDGINSDIIDPAEFDSANKNEDEDQPTERNLCMRSGNILIVLKPSLISLESTRLARYIFEVYTGSVC